MKRLAIIGIYLFIFAVAAMAKTQYVSEFTEITLRTGPGIDYKVIAMVKTGEKIEVIEPGGDWSKVRSEGEKTGWILSRFISSEIPSSIALERLEQKHNKLIEQSAAPLKEISRLTDENKNLSSELAESEKARKNLKNEHEALKRESTDFLKVKSDYEKAASQLAQQRTRAEKLEEKLAKLELNRNIRWFLSGAGVLFAGFILGFSAKRQRRRSSLL